MKNIEREIKIDKIVISRQRGSNKEGHQNARSVEFKYECSEAANDVVRESDHRFQVGASPEGPLGGEFPDAGRPGSGAGPLRRASGEL